MPGKFVELVWQHDPIGHAPARYRRACKYSTFIPDKLGGLKLEVDGGVAGLVSAAEHAIGALNESGNPALAPLSRLLLRTESIASSRIEGMQLGASHLARAEARAASGLKAGSDAMEILANIDAMVVAVNEAATTDPITVREIVSIHRHLMRNTLNKRVAGHVRTEQNWIGGNDYNPCGADFVPPPPHEVEALLDDLCDAMNDDLLPPLAQAALIHAQFETIHPFHDGNGRTGRALVQVVLRRRGIAPSCVPPISVVLAASRDRYIQGLTNFRFGSAVSWVEYFAASALRAASLARDYLEAAKALQENWRRALRAAEDPPRAGAAAWSIIDVLAAHPIMTAAIASESTGRSITATYQAIAQLQAAKVLIPISESRRNQAWEAAGLLELIEGLEAGVSLSEPRTNPQ